MGLAVGPLICFLAICSAECRGVAQTATFLLSLGLCNRSLFLSFLKNYACSCFPCFSKSHSGVWGHLIVNCCLTYYILFLVLGIISTVGNLRPFASDLIEERTFGTLLLYKLRVPLLLLFWIVAGGDCRSVCLLPTEPVITLLDSAAAECFSFLSYKTIFFLLFWEATLLVGVSGPLLPISLRSWLSELYIRPNSVCLCCSWFDNWSCYVVTGSWWCCWSVCLFFLTSGLSFSCLSCVTPVSFLLSFASSILFSSILRPNVVVWHWLCLLLLSLDTTADDVSSIL